MIVKNKKIKSENSVKKKLILALLVVNLFLFAFVIIPMLQLTQTVITKKPIVQAAQCAICGWDNGGLYNCVQGECNGTCGSDGICGSNCGDPNDPGCGDAACGPTAGSCASGTVRNEGPDISNPCSYRWDCSSATRSLTCSRPIDNCGVINGACGGGYGTCSSGTASLPETNESGSVWDCTGSNGGTTEGCAVSSGSPPTTKYTCSGTSCVVDSTGSSAITDPNCNGSCGTPDSGSINDYSCDNGTCVYVGGGGGSYSSNFCDWQCSATRYSCSDGSCTVDSSGPYTDSSCNGECGVINDTYYDCSGSLCMVNFSGRYTAPNCNNQCSIPQTKYSCNSSGNCALDPNGSYTTATCDGQCSKANEPTCTLTANPSTISSGASSTLNWSTTNTTSFKIDNVRKTPVASGSMSTGNLTANKTYTGTATGPKGSATCTATVSINDQPSACGTRARDYLASETAWPSGSTYCKAPSVKILPIGANDPRFPDFNHEVNWECLHLGWPPLVSCQAKRADNPPPPCSAALLHLNSPNDQAKYTMTSGGSVTVTLQSELNSCRNKEKYLRNIYRWTSEPTANGWKNAGSTSGRAAANLNLSSPVIFSWADIAKPENKKTDPIGVEYYEATYEWTNQGSYTGNSGDWDKIASPTRRQFIISTQSSMPSVDKLTCSIVPTKGKAPLTAKISLTTSGKCSNATSFEYSVGSDRKTSADKSGILYTYTGLGINSTSVTSNNGCSAQCNEVTVSSSGGGSGGEVTP